MKRAMVAGGVSLVILLAALAQQGMTLAQQKSMSDEGGRILALEKAWNWALEVKDVYAAFSARQIRDTVDEFLGPYTEQVERKAALCRAELPAFLRLLRVTDGSTRDWTVRPVIVTRRLEPAAFARDLRVPIVPLDGLVAYLRS